MHTTRLHVGLCIPFLSAVALSAACDGPPALTLPRSCPPGQILFRTETQWICSPPPVLAAPKQDPLCAKLLAAPVPNQVLSSDGNTLSCTTVDYGIGERLGRAQTALGTMADKVSRIEVLHDGLASSRYRGVTTATSSGAIKSPANEQGLVGATTLCAAAYSGSHLCSMPELYDSVARGVIGKDTRIPKSWIYFPSGYAAGGASQPLDGVADTCAGYTYGLDDRGWSGIAAEWTILPTGSVGFKFHGGTTGAPCSANLPLACCGGAS